MRSLLLRCYPAVWRARYGAEFQAVLEERPLRPSDVADILLGAVDAHRRARLAGDPKVDARPVSLAARVGGSAALVGAPLWTAGFLLANQDRTTGGPGMAAGILVTGSLLMLVALIGLSVVQARVQPVLSWLAFALPAAGVSGVTVGAAMVAFGASPPEVLFLGLLSFVLGSCLFGAVALRTGILSRGAACLLTIAPVLMILGGDGGGSGEVLIVSGLLAFTLGWVALGVIAMLHDPASDTPRVA